MWGGSLCLSGQPCPLPKAVGSQHSPVLEFLSIYVYTLCHRTMKFQWKHIWGRGLFLDVQPCPHPKGPSTPQFWGLLSIYAYTRWCRTTKSNVVTHMGRVRVFKWSAHTLIPKGRGPSNPQFLGFPSIYVHTLCHRTTKFAVVTYVGEVHAGSRQQA